MEVEFHWRVIVVPSDYSSFFDAASQAAGALIGLLFVVIALKPEKIVGPRAQLASRRLAVSSFTGLVNAFFVSLLAIIPGHNLGIGATVMAVLSLYHTLQLHLAHVGRRNIVVFVVSILAYAIELALAIAFILNPHDVDLVTDLAFVLIGCFSVALSRAWQLMESTAVETDQTPTADSPGSDSSDDTEHLGLEGRGVEGPRRR
jgi:hypothetical protein